MKALRPSNPSSPAAVAERVRVFLHGVADIDERRDLLLPRLLESVLQNPADLRLPAAAFDLLHQSGEALAVRHEARGAAFAKAPEINELHVESARARRRLEHAALQRHREIPRGLAAQGRVEREDEPPARARLRDRGRAGDLVEKGVDRLAVGAAADDWRAIGLFGQWTPRLIRARELTL